jgi:hypothetical protein
MIPQPKTIQTFSFPWGLLKAVWLRLISGKAEKANCQREILEKIRETGFQFMKGLVSPGRIDQGINFAK